MGSMLPMMMFMGGGNNMFGSMFDGMFDETNNTETENK